eukprot:gene10602-3120_t
MFNYLIAFTVVLLGSLFYNIYEINNCNFPGNDKEWTSYNPNLPYKNEKQIYSNFYIESFDKTKIAVDLILPSKKIIEQKLKIPTIIHGTRFGRSQVIKSPFDLLLGERIHRAKNFISSFVPRGYAYVTFDVRGTGASEGSRKYDFTESEIKDYSFVIDYITKQNWSNGKVGSLGISYDGMAAEYMTTLSKESLKAIATLFSPFDLYRDLAFPGGLFCTGFFEKYSEITTKLEQGELPPNYGYPDILMRFILDYAVKGVSPVNKDENQLKKSIKEHKNNLNYFDIVNEKNFKKFSNERIPSINGKSMDEISNHFSVEKFKKSKTAYYIFSSWYDASIQHSSIKRYLTLNSTKNKLVLGPWNHGARKNSSPHRLIDSTCFNLSNELLRFFDHHILDEKTNIYQEDPIHYFTIGEEKWKSTKVWPPKPKEKKVYHFSKNQKLIENEKGNEESFDVYNVNFDSTSGEISRWNLVSHLFLKPVSYDRNKKEIEKTHLIYKSSPLKENLESTGHPSITLFLEAMNKSDIAVFVYLEEVLRDGNVIYVTEGMLQGKHRHFSKNDNLVDVVPFRSFFEKDAKEMKGIEKLEINLIPISYKFRKGSKIRISITGSDRHNFKVDKKQFSEKWRVFHHSTLTL